MALSSIAKELQETLSPHIGNYGLAEGQLLRMKKSDIDNTLAFIKNNNTLHYNPDSIPTYPKSTAKTLNAEMKLFHRNMLDFLRKVGLEFENNWAPYGLLQSLSNHFQTTSPNTDSLGDTDISDTIVKNDYISLNHTHPNKLFLRNKDVYQVTANPQPLLDHLGQTEMDFKAKMHLEGVVYCTLHKKGNPYAIDATIEGDKITHLELNPKI